MKLACASARVESPLTAWPPHPPSDWHTSVRVQRSLWTGIRDQPSVELQNTHSVRLQNQHLARKSTRFEADPNRMGATGTVPAQPADHHQTDARPTSARLAWMPDRPSCDAFLPPTWWVIRAHRCHIYRQPRATTRARHRRRVPANKKKPSRNACSNLVP